MVTERGLRVSRRLTNDSVFTMKERGPARLPNPEVTHLVCKHYLKALNQ